MRKTTAEYIAELKEQLGRVKREKGSRSVVYSINADISNTTADETEKYFTKLGYIVVKTQCRRCENKWSMSISLPLQI